MEQDSLRNQKGVNNEMLFKITKEYLSKLVHKSIGALTFRDRYNQFLAGTATLISPNIILTAAHNIYDKKYKYEYSQFKFYLGACGEAEEYYEIESWRMMEQFKTCPDSQERIQFDFALMKLKDNPNLPINQTQFLSLESICQRCNREELTLSIFGYPIRQPGYDANYRPLDPQYKKMEINQYGLTCEGRVVEINISKCMISYFINTYTGQSGSAIINKNSIIGIHIIAGRNHEQFNIGKLFTINTIDILQEWVRELGGQAVNIYQHPHEQQFRRLMLTITHGQKQYVNRQYNRYRHLSVFQFLCEAIENSQPYHCLMVEGQVLMPGDQLNLIQTWGLKVGTKQLTVNILKDSARFYFYTVLYNQFKDIPLSTYHSDLPNLPDQTDINQFRRYILTNYHGYSSPNNPIKYRSINLYLLQELFAGRRDIKALKIIQTIAKIIKVCNNMPRSPSRFVFRGVGGLFGFPVKGQCYQLRTFTSTSEEKAVAQSFINRHNPLLFTYSHFTGKTIKQYSPFPHQNEVLIMPFTKNHIESKHQHAANLIELSGPIAYSSRILIWIEDFETQFYTEIQFLKNRYNFEVLYVPSFFIFTKWYEEYGWLLKWKKTEVRIVLNISVLTKKRSNSIFGTLGRAFQTQGIFQKLQNSGVKQNIINEETQFKFLRWFYNQKRYTNKVLAYCSNSKTYQDKAKINSIKGNFVFADKLLSIQQFMKFE